MQNRLKNNLPNRSNRSESFWKKRCENVLLKNKLALGSNLSNLYVTYIQALLKEKFSTKNNFYISVQATKNESFVLSSMAG
jgi:hypothetical protein